ncbi:MAG: ankyrin repeat domain-containing protein, partial [Maribacter dokdonensis]
MKNLLILTIMISTLTGNAQNIFEASRTGDVETLRNLYNQNKESINAVDSKGFTPLILSAYNNQKEVVSFLLEKGCDVNAKDTSGNTA